MKRFNVTVNGVTYDVTVEEIGGAAPAPVAAPAPAAAPVAAAAPAAAPVAAAPVAPVAEEAEAPVAEEVVEEVAEESAPEVPETPVAPQSEAVEDEAPITDDDLDSIMNIFRNRNRRK